MRHLFEDWESIQIRIEQSQNLLLFLDYDGTLTPIVTNPEHAICPFEVKRSLQELKEVPGVYIIIISGRSLKDLKERVGIKGIFYVGNHGLEIEKPDGLYKKPFTPKRTRELNAMAANLINSLRNIPGIIFEDKGFIMSIHYRNTPTKYFPKILNLVKEELDLWKNHWRIVSGKMVLEIMPDIEFNKGKAVIEILKSFKGSKSLPVYLGDDRTDEDAFLVLKGKGLTVFIGQMEASSHADFFLRSPREVQEFLLRCLEIRIKKKMS